MAEAGPYGITQFDAAGVINNYQAAKENRIRSLILQKQMDAADKADRKESAIQKVVSDAYGGGDTPVSAPAATTAAQSSTSATAAPSAAPSQSRVPSGADREKLIGQLMAIDAPTAEKYIDLFSKMDKSQADQFTQRNGQIMQLMGGLIQQPAANRKAAIQQYAPDLLKLGYTQDQIANFDPSDENLRSEMARHMDASKIAEFVKPDLMAVGPNTALIDKNHPDQGAVYTSPADYHQFMVHNADGTDSPYGFDPKTGRAFQLRDDGQPGSPTDGATGGFDHAVDTVLSNEGGYNAHDMNGHPVNFGINQGANPGVDVKNLTRDQARQIYHDKYWVPSGAENLPANLQTPYFDVYIRNPEEAKKALDQSGGDPAKFMQLSSNYFQTLAQKPNGAKYAKAWAARDAKNLTIATGGVSSSGSVPITGKPLSPDAGADETAQFIGGQVALGQPMPPLGMGKEAAQMRRAILTEATKQWKAMGISPGEANVIAAQNKSGLAELAKIAQMKAMVQTAEDTASSNATQVLSLLGSAGSTGSPIFNSWQQAGRRATGNAKVSAFDVAVKTLATEYARVMSGGNSQQLSDSARHEADALIHTSMTPDQFRSAINQMKIDMTNRTNGIEKERQATLQQIRSGGRSAPAEEHWVTLPSGLKVRRVQ